MRMHPIRLFTALCASTVAMKRRRDPSSCSNTPFQRGDRVYVRTRGGGQSLSGTVADGNPDLGYTVWSDDNGRKYSSVAGMDLTRMQAILPGQNVLARTTMGWKKGVVQECLWNYKPHDANRHYYKVNVDATTLIFNMVKPLANSLSLAKSKRKRRKRRIKSQQKKRGIKRKGTDRFEACPRKATKATTYGNKMTASKEWLTISWARGQPYTNIDSPLRPAYTLPAEIAGNYYREVSAQNCENIFRHENGHYQLKYFEENDDDDLTFAKWRIVPTDLTAWQKLGFSDKYMPCCESDYPIEEWDGFKNRTDKCITNAADFSLFPPRFDEDGDLLGWSNDFGDPIFFDVVKN